MFMAEHNSRRKGHKTRPTINTPEANDPDSLPNMAEDVEGEISLQTLWKEIKTSKEEISKQMDRMTNDIQAKLTRIETSMSTLSEQMVEVETRVSATEDDLRDTRSTVTHLEKDVAYLKDKVQDLENRSRRSNIRIVNLPEKSIWFRFWNASSRRSSASRTFHLLRQLRGPTEREIPRRIGQLQG